MSATVDLIAVVRAKVEGTPLVVDETDTGFDVRVDVEAPRWSTVLRERGLSETAIQHVRLDEAARTLAITDELRSVTWSAGADGRLRATLATGASVASGKVRERRFRRTYAIGPDGLQQESEWSFDSGAGRDLVEEVAKAQGWRRERGLNEKIGLAVGVGTIVLIVLMGVVVGVIALLGGFSGR